MEQNRVSSSERASSAQLPADRDTELLDLYPDEFVGLELVPHVEALGDDRGADFVDSELLPVNDASSKVAADATSSQSDLPADADKTERIKADSESSRRYTPAFRRTSGGQRAVSSAQLPYGPLPYGPPPIARTLTPDVRNIPEWCSIVLAHTDGRTGEFQIVKTESGGRRHVEGSSARFSVPRSLRLRKHGAPRAAYEALVKELLANGWQAVEARGRWHDSAFIRYRTDAQEKPR